MHFSQIYRPDEIARLLDARVPPALRARIITVEHSDPASECSWTAVGIEEVLLVVRGLLTRLTATRSRRD